MERRKGTRFSLEYQLEYQKNLDILRKILSRDLEIDSHPIVTILEMDSEEATRLVVVSIYKIISNAKSDSSEYESMNASPHDNIRGVTSTNIKKYMELIEKNMGEFIKKYQQVIEKFELKKQVEELIQEAKEFKGTNSYHRDSSSHPGSNHHTGRPYY